MTTLALDLSKRSTGWAVWSEGWESPRYAAIQLGSEFTTDGRTCLKLHRVLADLHQVMPFTSIYYEKPLTQVERGGASNPANDVQLKLVGHAESFAEAYNIRICMGVNMKSWRRHFLGSMPRGTKTKALKDYAIERCRHYGWKPKTHDEADALGLLDYALDLQGIKAPWVADEVLRPILGGAK